MNLNPTIGEKSVCKVCGNPIVYARTATGSYWEHFGTEHYEHVAKPITTNALILPNEVVMEKLSSTAIKLALQYMERVEDEEHPRDAMEQKGYTPLELGTRRRVAHNKLMAELVALGIDVSNRSAITELARLVERWIRE